MQGVLKLSRSLGKEGIPDAMISALVVSLILGAKIGKVLWFDRSSIGILKFLLHSLPLDFDSTESFFF